MLRCLLSNTRPSRLAIGIPIGVSALALLGWLGSSRQCCADEFVIAPAPYAGSGLVHTGTFLPFLIFRTTPCGGLPAPAIRYQQVYAASLFTNIPPRLIYISSLAFYIGPVYGPPPGAGAEPWTVSWMQVSLSTTPKAPDRLSPIFSENVGPDETIVAGPGAYQFFGGPEHEFPQYVLFSRPFRYDPQLGNLLMDVRITNVAWYCDEHGIIVPSLSAYNSPTDEVSRIWSTNVDSLVAESADSMGLEAVIAFSPVPSLVAQVRPAFPGASSNVIEISWPPQPTNFILQRLDYLGGAASWQPVTDRVWATWTASDPYNGRSLIEIPTAMSGSRGFYRLLWPGGIGASAVSSPTGLAPNLQVKSP